MIRNYEWHESEQWWDAVTEMGLAIWSPPPDRENGPSTDDASMWAVDPEDNSRVYGYFNCLEEGGDLADTPAEYERLLHEG